MEINSFVVKVFSSDVCIYDSGIRRATAASEIYQDCISKYLSGFRAKKEGFAGCYQINVYTDMWIYMQVQRYKDNPIFAEHIIRRINHTYYKGHMKIEFKHSNPIIPRELIFKDGQLVEKEEEV